LLRRRLCRCAEIAWRGARGAMDAGIMSRRWDDSLLRAVLVFAKSSVPAHACDRLMVRAFRAPSRSRAHGEAPCRTKRDRVMRTKRRVGASCRALGICAPMSAERASEDDVEERKAPAHGRPGPRGSASSRSADRRRCEVVLVTSRRGPARCLTVDQCAVEGAPLTTSLASSTRDPR